MCNMEIFYNVLTPRTTVVMKVVETVLTLHKTDELIVELLRRAGGRSAMWKALFPVHSGGKLRVFRDCPHCGTTYSARVMRRHIPLCRRQFCETDSITSQQ